jgi:hypothetical protein
MSILMGGRRSRRRAAKPSVREVCLLGTSPAAPACESGGRVSVSGRSYRVAAVQEGGATRYVYLAAEGEG